MKLPLKDIKPNPENPRIIKDDKFKKLVQSLKDFPEMAEVREIVVNKDHVILGGNMRFKAMKEAGWTEAPVKIVDWPEDKQREFIIKDNVSGGEWDFDVLANEWDADLLDSWGLDLPISLEDEEVIEDEAPEVSPDPPISKLGEIYQLGRHRVMCGDSTDRANVELLMDGVKADMVFTDPPYGMSFSSGRQTEEVKRVKVWGVIENDDLRGEALVELLMGALKALGNVVKPNIPIYICLSWRTYKENIVAIESAGLTIANCIVWDKGSIGIGNRNYRPQHEFILYCKDERTPWYGDKAQSDIWTQGRDATTSYDHPTQKPIYLPSKAINNSTKTGDTVLDSFLGSGSTLIACEQTDRTCYGMELDPKYVDVIRKRYAKFMNNNELPENWEELTPKISEESANNG